MSALTWKIPSSSYMLNGMIIKSSFYVRNLGVNVDLNFEVHVDTLV